MRSSGAARISHRDDDRAVRAPVSEGPDGLESLSHGKRPADDGCDHQLPNALIDPGRADSDEQLVVTDHRRFDLPEPQDVRRAICVLNDCPHGVWRAYPTWVPPSAARREATSVIARPTYATRAAAMSAWRSAM